jgi:hypothetical protein
MNRPYKESDAALKDDTAKVAGHRPALQWATDGIPMSRHNSCRQGGGATRRSAIRSGQAPTAATVGRPLYSNRTNRESYLE